MDCNCDGPMQHIDESSSYEIMDKDTFYLPVYSVHNQSILIPLSEISFNMQNPTTTSNNKPIINKKKTKKRKHGEAYYKEVETTSRRPIYIDIEISKTEAANSFSKETKDGTIYQGKQKYLEECVDIHTVLQSRRTHTIPKLKEKWGAEKLDKYGSLSDAELIKEGNAKCSYPNEIVNQSINDIKQSIPKKIGGSKLHVKNSVNHQMYSKVSSFHPDMSVHVQSTSTGSFANIDNSGTSTSVVTNKEYKVHKNEQKNSNSVGMVDEEHPLYDWPHEFEFTIVNGTETLNNNLEIVTTTSSTKPLIDYAHTTNNLLITKKQKETNNEINNSINKKPTDEVTGIVPMTNSGIYQYYDEATLNYLEDLAVNDNYFPTETPSHESTTENGYNKAVQTTTSTYRETIVKNKLYSDLMPLHTVTPDVPFMEAISTIPPSYTKLPYDKSPFDEYMSGDPTVYQTTTEVSTNLNGDLYSSKLSDLEVMKESSLSGSMFFNFGNEYIPARFIQDSTGQLTIRIDIKALCDKLNYATNGSVLIGVMCKCAQSEICRS